MEQLSKLIAIRGESGRQGGELGRRYWDKSGRRSRLIRKKIMINLFCCDQWELGTPENSMQMHAGTVHAYLI